MSLNTIPGIGGDGSVTATTTPQKIANSLSVQRVVTISSLKDVAGTVDGETVLCEGYYTKGDCEPLSYYWDDDSVLSDDGVDSTHPGLVVQPTSVSGAGRWIARTPNYVNVRWYGASTSLTDNQLYIQRACDAVINSSSWPQDVFIPSGTYSCSGPIVLHKGAPGTVAQAFSLQLRGEGGFPYVGRFTKLVFTHNDSFGIGAHRAKGLRISKLFLEGRNAFTFPEAYTAFTTPESNYVVNSCRTNTLSPYSGIVIDPFGDNTVPAGDRYPGLSAYYISGNGSGGSTDVLVEECFVWQFVSNFTISPSGTTTNAEQFEFRRCRGERCQVNFAICQLQSRSVNIVNFTCWGNCLYFIDCSTYGSGAGQLPYIFGGNFAGHVKYLFHSGATVSAVSVNSLFCESIHSIGRMASATASFIGCIFKFTPATANNFATPMTYLFSSGTVAFYGCTIIQSANNPTSKIISFNCNRLAFTDCAFDVPPINRNNATDSIIHRNSVFRHISIALNQNYTTGETAICLPASNFNRVHIAPGQTFFFPTAATFFKRSTNTAGTLRSEFLEGASVSLTITPNGQTATFTTAQPARWTLGSRPCLPVVIAQFVTDEFGQTNVMYPTAFVQSVVGNTVTLGGVSPILASGTYQIFSVLPHEYHDPTIGTTTSGSNVITNVRSQVATTVVWSVGDAISGTGIPVGSYVTAVTSGQITINQNCTASGVTDLFDAPIRTIAQAAAQPTTGGWTKGDLVDDTTGATNGWRCTGSGTFGSGTDPTFATR